MKSLPHWSDLPLERDWEEEVLEYAINTFPYADDFNFLPGFHGDEREVLTGLLEAGLLRIGFYYEEMLSDLKIFYFLQVYDNTFIILGKDANLRVEIVTEGGGMFPLDDEQYLELSQTKLN